MTLEETAQDIREEFAFLDDWEERYAHLIDLGKSNTPLADAERCEANRVRGCASQVWLVSDTTDDGRLLLRAESDAMIVSGLIALLIRLFSGQPTRDILAFNPAAFLEEIGVSGALTAQRSNGLASMIQRIQTDARALDA
jgi:cysteine desulfuration protein SufE